MITKKVTVPNLNSVPKLQHFRQILFWPLRFIPPKTDTKLIEKNGFVEYMQEKLLKDPESVWSSQDKLYDRGTATDEITNYAELVYFHPFIQRFLYNTAENFEGNKRCLPVLQICKRTDIKSLEIILRNKEKLEFSVDRVHLYLFDIEVSILVMEISSNQLVETELSTIQDFLDQFRRAYPPYWDDSGAGHSPQSVKFFGKNKELLTEGLYNDSNKYLNFAEKFKIPPLAEHWKFLLKPFEAYERFNVNTDKVRYLQIEDERIPYMAYLAFDDPRLLTKGDMIRLGLADEGGNSNTLPYSSSFADNFERDYCYDRFWESQRHDWMNTRFICCGYAFTMIGKGDSDSSFFRDGKVGALAHFRHHYFQMGLIAHFHKAALLMLWDELAQAVAKFSQDRQSREEFYEDVREILEKLLHFTHRYWFTEVSNQIQAKELFDMWSNHLGSRELFDRIMKEAQDAHQYLDMNQQKSQTDTILRLTVVATSGLVVALTVDFFGSNISEIWGWKSPYSWTMLFCLIAILIFGVLFILYNSKTFADIIEVIAEKRFFSKIPKIWKKSFWSSLWRALKPNKREDN